MHMHNGQICMKSYPQVISFIINVLMHSQQRSLLAICICVSVFCRINFETYISENKGFGDFGYEFSLCIFKVQGLHDGKYGISLCEEWGGTFVPSLLSFSLESFYKFLHQLVQVDFIFHFVYSGFRVQEIADMVSCSLQRVRGKLYTIVVKLFI